MEAVHELAQVGAYSLVVFVPRPFNSLTPCPLHPFPPLFLHTTPLTLPPCSLPYLSSASRAARL